MRRLRAQQNLVNNWVNIVLTVISVIQGFAFNYLLQQFLDKFGIHHSRDYVLLLHFILSFVVLLRIFQAYMTAVLDYNYGPASFFEILLIPAVGVIEYSLICSLISEPFKPIIFHAIGIVICMVAVLAHFLTLLKFRRRKLQPRSGKPGVIKATVTLLQFLYKPSESYLTEVRLQELNIAGLITIILIELLFILSGPGRREQSILASLIILILSINIYFSVRITFKGGTKLSKQPSN